MSVNKSSPPAIRSNLIRSYRVPSRQVPGAHQRGAMSRAVGKQHGLDHDLGVERMFRGAPHVAHAVDPLIKPRGIGGPTPSRQSHLHRPGSSAPGPARGGACKVPRPARENHGGPLQSSSPCRRPKWPQGPRPRRPWQGTPRSFFLESSLIA